MPALPVTPAYRKLIQTIQGELHEGMRLAEEDVRWRRVTTYWRIGRHMHHFFLHTDDRSGNETPHLRKIAGELGYSLDVTRKIPKFYMCYPKLTAKPDLSWT